MKARYNNYSNLFCNIKYEFRPDPDGMDAAWNYYINEKKYDALDRNKLDEDNFKIAY